MNCAFLHVDEVGKVSDFVLQGFDFGNLLVDVKRGRVEFLTHDDITMWSEITVSHTDIGDGIILSNARVKAVDTRLASLNKGGSEANTLNSLTINVIDSEFKKLDSKLIFSRNTFEVPVSDNYALVDGDDGALADEVPIVGGVLREDLIVNGNIGNAAVILTVHNIEAESDGRVS